MTARSTEPGQKSSTTNAERNPAISSPPLLVLMFAVTTLVWLPLTTAACSIIVAGLLFGTVLQASSHSTDTARGVHDEARTID